MNYCRKDVLFSSNTELAMNQELILIMLLMMRMKMFTRCHNPLHDERSLVCCGVQSLLHVTEGGHFVECVDCSIHVSFMVAMDTVRILAMVTCVIMVKVVKMTTIILENWRRNWINQFMCIIMYIFPNKKLYKFL